MRTFRLRHLVVAACLGTAAALAGAQPAAFLAVSVASLDRQVAWYRDTLGFELVQQRDVSERGIRFALLRREGALLELLHIPEARPRSVVDPTATSASRIHGFFKGGMVVSDLDALHRRLQQKAVPFALPLGERDANGLRSFQLRDPEGNLIQFVGE